MQDSAAGFIEPTEQAAVLCGTFCDYFNSGKWSVFQYKATDFVASGPGTFSMSYAPSDGSPAQHWQIFYFTGEGGIGMAMYNTDEVRAVQWWNSDWLQRNPNSDTHAAFCPL